MWLCHPRRGSWDCWPQLTKLHWNHPLSVMPFPEGGRAGERVDAAFHPQLHLSVPVMCGSRGQFSWHLLSDAGSPLRWFPIREQCCNVLLLTPLPLLSPPQEGGVAARGSFGHPGRRGLGHAAARGIRHPQRGARSRARPRSAAAPPRWSRSRGPLCAA